MIQNKTRRLIVHGLGMASGTRYKAADGTIKAGRWVVADDTGGGIEPGLAFGVTETPYGMAYATGVLNAGVTYALSGTVAPVDATVHLSRAGYGATPAELEAGEFATVQPDAEGAWSYDDLEGSDDTLYAWIKVDNDVLDMLDCDIMTNMQIRSIADTPGNIVSTALDLPPDNGYSWPTITIAGRCPAAATKIVVSEYAPGKCLYCGGTGKAFADCPVCGGTWRVIRPITCQNCGGSGEVDCPSCGGTGVLDGTTCADCAGTGKATCDTCGGVGANDTKVVCDNHPDCIGGKVVSEDCPHCGGTGETQDAPTAEALLPKEVSVVTPSEGQYSATFEGKYIRDHGSMAADTRPCYSDLPPELANRLDARYSQYLIWCEGDAGEITASMTWTDNQCLAGDTLITMADGSKRRLDEIRPGDLLLSGDWTPTGVLLVRRGVWNTYHTLYRFEDGTVIDEIHDHRFYCVEAGFWQLLRRWEIGQHAVREDGTEVALAAIERVEEPAEMFGLWTESRDYWANGLLSGETAANQMLLADATAEQAADMLASLEERAILQLLGAEDLMP